MRNVRVLALALLLVMYVAARASGAPPQHPELNPLFSAEWWLRGHSTVTDWVGRERSSDGVDALGAWPASAGEGVVVAVVDSGVDLRTRALKGRLLPGMDLVTGRALRGDALGHGTYVATLVAGNPEHGDGIYGVAPAARILPLRVGDAYGSIDEQAAAAALAYAIRDPRVRVINISWERRAGVDGGPPSGIGWGPPTGRLLEDALRAVARKRSVLVVTAAGNDARELTDGLLPQSFDGPSELTVASSDQFDELSLFSNYGAHVELAAPGERILSAIPGDKLMLADGTSMAAPIVSGVAALLIARYPQASAAQVKQAIISSCTPAPDLAGRVACGGIVNAPGALDALRILLGAHTESPAANGLCVTCARGS